MYIVILVIEVICIWFVFVETRGLTLEEVGQLLDGPVLVERAADMSDKASIEEERVEVAKG